MVEVLGKYDIIYLYIQIYRFLSVILLFLIIIYIVRLNENMAKNNANIGFEKQIWDAACVLWGHIPAAEYRKVNLDFLNLSLCELDYQIINCIGILAL